MNDHATLALSIRPGAPIVEETPDSLTFNAPETGALTLKPLAPGLATALRSLTTGYTTEEQLTAMVMTTEGVQALVPLHQNLARLSGRGLLCHRLQVEGQPFAEMIPIARYYYYRPRLVQPDTPYQFSRFAYMRHANGQMVAESPRGFAQVVMHDPRAAQLVAEFARPQTCRDLASVHPELPAHVVESFANFLLNAEMLVPVDEDCRTPEDTTPALVPWEFHDLLFHSRTRAGRHANPFGGTFRFRGKVDPPPMVKPAMSEDSLALYKPDVDELRRTDPPFAAVLESRKSIRDYGEQPITDRQLGEFLYRTARIKHVVRHGPGEMEFGLRNYPGGGAVYELEIYPVIGECQNIPAGLYHYQPLEHRLCRIAGRKAFVDALLRVAWITADRHSEPEVCFVITARYQRVTWKYQSMAYALHLKNLGALYQTMYLVATAMGLAPCALGGGDSDLFAHASGLDYYTESSIGEFLLGSRASDPHDPAK